MSNKVYLEDDILYKKIDEIKIGCININRESKKIVKINVSDEEKLIHMIDIEYKRPNKNKKELLIIVPKQRLIEIDYDKKIIKIEINDEIERKIKELEVHLKNLIYKNSIFLFKGKQFSLDKISNGLISNIKSIRDRNKYIKFIPFSINARTNLYEIDKNGNRKIINNFNFNKWKEENKGSIYCKCVITIENLQFVDNRFTYNLVINLCEIEKYYNYSFVIKNGELQRGEIDSEEDTDKLEDEYWDSASI